MNRHIVPARISVGAVLLLIIWCASCRGPAGKPKLDELIAEARVEGIARYEADTNFFKGEDLYIIGRFYFEEGRYQAAAGVFERFIAFAPGDPRGWVGLGNAYVALKQWDNALPAYSKADELGELQALPMIFVCYIGRGDYGKAEKDAPRLLAYIKNQEQGSSSFWQTVCTGLCIAISLEPPNKALFEEFAAFLPHDESLWRADARDLAEKGFKLFGRSIPAQSQTGERHK